MTWEKNSRARSPSPLGVVAAVAVAVAAAGCHARQVPRDELVVLIESPALSIDPRYTTSAYDFRISRMVYAPLVTADTPTLEPAMQLAESVRPLGNDWEITLREARFSDGKPVTADDVAYTFAELRNPAGKGAVARLRASFKESGLQTVEVRDARHLVAHMSRLHAPFVTDLNFGVLERPQPGTPADAPAVGAGPFVVAEHRGEDWTLTPNPYYFGGKPPVAKLTFKVIRDDNSRLLALVGGSADLTTNNISQLLLDAVAEQPRLQLLTDRSAVYSYLGLNQEDPILKDVRVRQAIAYAIDRNAIVHNTLHDHAVLATGMLPISHWAYNGEVPSYGFDPARSKRLLDEAGYPDPDGDGPRKRFTLTYKTSSNKLRVAIASVIAHMLEEVGIGVELRVYEFATFFADVKKGNFQLFSMQLPEISEPDIYINFFASWRIPTRAQPDAGGNRVRYRSPEADALIQAGRSTIDRGERRRIYGDLQRTLARDLPVISLWHEDNVAAMRKGVRGFSLVPTGQLVNLAKTYKVE